MLQKIKQQHVLLKYMVLTIDHQTRLDKTSHVIRCPGPSLLCFWRLHLHRQKNGGVSREIDSKGSAGVSRRERGTVFTKLSRATNTLSNQLVNYFRRSIGDKCRV